MSVDATATRMELKRQIEEAVKLPHTTRIVWRVVFILLTFHLLAVVAVFKVKSAQFPTLVWGYCLYVISLLGITVGAHRLFAHRSFDASFGLRLFLVLGHTIAGQHSLHTWVRDHRQHHRHSDTAADPHDARRGLLFTHFGWLAVRRHPAVLLAGRAVELDDLDADPLVVAQRRYYIPLFLTFNVLIPVAVPCLLWNETLWHSFLIAYILRFVYVLNVTLTANSVAHKWGSHPYDKSLPATDNWYSTFVTWGEGWHNYHHVFPWDYRSAEFGVDWNLSASFIDWCAEMGWATNRRTASKALVRRTVAKRGDGSHQLSEVGDKDI